MDYFTYKRTLLMTVILLVILNLGTLTTIWFLRKPGGEGTGILPPPPPPLPPPVNFQAVIAGGMGLSERQKIRFDEASVRFLRRSEYVMQRYHADKRRMFAELGQKQPDSLLLGHLTTSLGRQQTELEHIMVDYLLELRGFCTAEQLERFPQVIEMMMEKLSL